MLLRSPSTLVAGALSLLLCLCFLAPGPTFAQTPVFSDDFEDGTTNIWATVIGLNRQACNCYFSSDCNSGFRCYWGPSLTVEDVCTWWDGKPSGNPGTGCDIPHVGPWGGDICDGVCTPVRLGSNFGFEEPEAVLKVVRLWSDAILEPAREGGPVNAELAAEARAVPLSSPELADLLGREVASTLSVVADRGFYDHFCHFEQGKDEPLFYVDLAGDECRYQAGRQILDSLAAELEEPGSGGVILQRIPAFCAGWEGMFAPRCSGPNSLECLEGMVRDTAEFLRTPRALDFERMLRSALP